MLAALAVPVAIGLVVIGLPVVVIMGISGTDAAGGSEGVGAVKAGAIPAKYRDLVLAAGSKCKTVTAPIIAAQIEAESNWNPKAGSPVGAQGIAQFMPGTWATWGKDYSKNGKVSVFEPADAIGSQADFMCALSRQVGQKLKLGTIKGDHLELVLAGYNAGMGNVQKYRGVPPFPETRNYVKKITGAAKSKFSQETIEASDSGAVVLPIKRGKYVNSNNYGNSGSLWARKHTGNDFSSPCGTPVRAAHGGTIVRDPGQGGWAGPNFVKVSNGQGKLATWYAHMMRLAVSDGAKVRAGETIGYVGTLGNSTGCHLHFEVHPNNGRYAQDDINPVPWLRKKGLKP